jgi:DNA polymerase III alpha subunit
MPGSEGSGGTCGGSGAGSLVAYCLGITRVDPIELDLIFERFLNPARVSMAGHRHRLPGRSAG